MNNRQHKDYPEDFSPVDGGDPVSGVSGVEDENLLKKVDLQSLFPVQND